MAKLNFVTIPESDFSGGVDAQSSKGKIPQGYLKSAINADPLPTGGFRKRTGYQGYAGELPLRVERIDYTDDATNNIKLYLNQAIRIPYGKSSPLILLGRTSSLNAANVGDFPNDSDTIKYYAEFLSESRITVPTGTNTLSYPQANHGLSTPNLFVSVLQSDDATLQDNTLIGTTSLSINKSTYNISADVTNSTGAEFKSFFLVADKNNLVNSNYAGSTSAAGATESILTGTNTYTITAATHQLTTSNIQVKVYEDDGTSYNLLEVDDVTIDTSSLDVDITLINSTGSAFNAVFVLSAAPATQKETGSVASGASGTIVIDNSAYDDYTNFVFASAYMDNGDGTVSQVGVDSVSVDADALTTTISFTNNSPSAAAFEVYWEYADITANTLLLSGSTISTVNEFNDTAPQLSVWGLSHSDLYPLGKTARESWTNYIDSYRSNSESRLLAGLGGNICAARLASESGNDTTYLLNTLYPDLSARVPSETILSPVFHSSTPDPARSRGYITGTTIGTNLVEITDVAYNSGTGYVDYTLSVPSMSLSTSLSTIISTDSGLEDYLTVSQCGYSVTNGTFKIRAATQPTSTTLKISVENSSITNSDFDETDVGGFAGIFTDRITFSATNYFLPDDIVLSEVTELSDAVTVELSSGSSVVVSGITSTFSVPANLRMFGYRTSYIVPLRTSTLNDQSVLNLVRGDMLTYTGLDRQLKIVSINQDSNRALSITGDGTTATVTMSAGDTTRIYAGKKVLITGSTSYSGVQTVLTVPTSTTFTFSTTASTTESATLVGKTVEIDEQLTFYDVINALNKFTVHSRWIPIEKPTDSYDTTPETVVSHFDSKNFSNQEILRSVMVQDNSYINNYEDEPMKFDGTNIYRAGLPSWQPGCFITSDTGATGKITTYNPTVTVGSVVNNTFKFTLGNETAFVVGDKIKHSSDGALYTVTSVSENGTDGIITVDRDISSATAGTVTRISVYNYYFRLNAVDANENVVASAVVQHQDFTISLGADAAVYLRLAGFPSLDVYDYDKLELQIYRTKANTSTYYLLTTLPMSFDSDSGYVDYTDTASDDDLVSFDNVHSRLKAGELGTAWTNPLRAKYCTTAGNRLVLGNIQAYPQLDIQVESAGGILTQSTFTNSSNRRWLFRKDSTDTGTSTNMTDRAAYEFVATSGATSITPATDLTNNSGTSFTVASTSHGLSAGDWVYLFHSAVTDGSLLEYAGWFQIASVNANDFTINHSHSSSYTPSADDVDVYITAATTTDIPVPIGTDGSMAGDNQNPSSSVNYRFTAMTRLAAAINASMRNTDITLSGQTSFTPWMIAKAGNTFAAGQLLIQQPKVFSTTLEVLLPALTGDFNVFVNEIKRSGSAEVSASTEVFPSRILASYPNYPEIFDNPTAVLDIDSDSAIDINPADGQQITGIIPFFGESAFGSSQKSNIVVVFKQNSIYVVDLTAKARGENPVQRIASRGIGCTAPYSIAPTLNGIQFANESGIFKLDSDLQVSPVGRKYERIWKEETNLDKLAIFAGHHDQLANSYKLSYVASGGTENSKVAVYNYLRSTMANIQASLDSQLGSLTTYTNHPATGWANLIKDSYFASTGGRVFIIRRLNEVSDYRDDSSAVDMEVVTRPIDAGNGNVRKLFSYITTIFQSTVRTAGTTITSALDFSNTFSSTDTFEIDPVEEGADVLPIDTTLQKVAGTHLTLKYSNSTIDEPVEVSEILLLVGGKGAPGGKEAKKTID